MKPKIKLQPGFRAPVDVDKDIGASDAEVRSVERLLAELEPGGNKRNGHVVVVIHKKGTKKSTPKSSVARKSGH